MKAWPLLLVAAGVSVAQIAGAPKAAASLAHEEAAASGPRDLHMDFPADRQERRQLPNGDEYFAASGTITNVGTDTQSVPTILIVLRDADERIVYSVEVEPAKRSLAPGESVDVVHAIADVPRSANVAEIGWKPE